jgi:hypothetical protein
LRLVLHARPKIGEGAVGIGALRVSPDKLLRGCVGGVPADRPKRLDVVDLHAAFLAPPG